jgi:tungstate transport system permease protein
VELLLQGIKQAIILILRGDPEIFSIAWLSLKVSGSAVLISLLLGVPWGIFLALARFPGRRFLVTLTNTAMGLPPVVVGLFVSLFLWRSGPLGFLELLYTPAAMVIAQVVIAEPIVAGLTLSAIQQLDPRLGQQALSLGASRWQMLWTLVKEAKLPTLAGIMAGFGGVISEVGAVMMVGGNIKGQTRVLTTATVLETRIGRFEMAIALGFILLILAFAVNLVLTLSQQRGAIPWHIRGWK